MKRAIRWVLTKLLLWVCFPVNYCVMLPCLSIGRYIAKDEYSMMQSIKHVHDELMLERRIVTGV